MTKTMSGKVLTPTNRLPVLPLGNDNHLGTDQHMEGRGLDDATVSALLRIHGKNVLPEKKVSNFRILINLLLEPMPIIIWFAIFIEIVLEKWTDGAILVFIQFTNTSIAFYETCKAKSAMSALKSSLPPQATVKRNCVWVTIDMSNIVPGDLVLLVAGYAVPADCRVINGSVEVDQSQLTGESKNIKFKSGDVCKMGSTVQRGESEAVVEATGASTMLGRTASLLQTDANEQSNLQIILVDIMIILVFISLVLCSIVFLHLCNITSIVEALSFTVVLLVASIPLAIEIVTTTTLALGSKELSAHGAIVKRLSAIEDLAGMEILCSDKTGTLTMNKMELQQNTPIYSEGENIQSLIRYAALATKWLEPPKDAIDTLILKAIDVRSLEGFEHHDFVPFDPLFKRTESTVRYKDTNEHFKVSKGAPHIILDLIKSLQVGGGSNSKIAAMVDKDVESLGLRGIRCIAVARTINNGSAWVMLGLITFLDPPRSDTVHTIHETRKLGVGIKMITGDSLLIAKETSKRIDMGTDIVGAECLPLLDPTTNLKPSNLSENYGNLILRADGFAQVFPEHKYLIIECLRELGYKTGMTGDGVNDAPALQRADVGIAVAGATDAARAASAIVLTQPGLSTITHGIVLSRCIFVRIKNFIIYRIAATLQLLIFFFIATFTLRPVNYEPEDQDDHNWPIFFHMPVIMIMIITLLNDGTLISIAYDNVEISKNPCVWNLQLLFTVGILLATVACASSLLLLYLSLDSWREGGFYQLIGLGGLSYGQITTSIFLKVAVSDFLTLFSARAGDKWFFQSRSSPILLFAASLALVTSTIVACVWPSSRPDGLPTIGLLRKTPYILPVFIWLYCLVWFLIQDAAKVFAYRIIKKNMLFGLEEVINVKSEATKMIDDYLETGGYGGSAAPAPARDKGRAMGHSTLTNKKGM